MDYRKYCLLTCKTSFFTLLLGIMDKPDIMNDPAKQLTLKSINQLFDNSFFIPAYQRGYRWTDTQVNQLLGDIWQFSTDDGKKRGEFYCLQPIVVKQKNDMFEVIDGQQRLTTVFLILKYLEEIIKMAFNNFSFLPPSYETRKDSKEFLDNVKTKTEDEAMLDIDYFHIRNAYCTIKEWFENPKNKINKIDFVNTLLKSQIEEQIDISNNVRVIWYEVNETENNNSIDIFTRLNIGKIPLTNAELVKALFLKKSNFSSDEKAELKQIQIASEWDTIEKTLQDDAFWLFIYNPENPLQYVNRIEYIFDLMKGRTKESEFYHTFNEFYRDFSDKDNKPNIDKLWFEIKKCFLTFEGWFKDYELYHYIGYLIDCGKDVITIMEKTANKTKKEFKDYLIEEIKIKYKIEDLKYKDPRVKEVLLLFNIQTVLKTQKSDMRFPFYKYKKEDWDIEHICSQTDKKINSQNQLAWINDILEYFTGTSDINEAEKFSKSNCESEKTEDEKLDEKKEKDICNSLIEIKKLNKIDDVKFNDVYNEVQKYFKEDSQTGEKNDISNFALLNSTINRSYGNSFFPIKRKIIIKNDKDGIFIPIATKNLFLKYYSKIVRKIMYWTVDDTDDYLEAIKTTLEDFLPKQDKQ